MPTVHRIQTEALPGVRRSQQRIAQVDAPVLRVQPPPEAFGAQLGETVAKVGEAFLGEQQRRMAEEREKATARANETKVNGAIRQVQILAQQRMWTPKTGAMYTEGLEAGGIHEQVLGELDTYADDQREQLNEDQKFLFNRLYPQHRAQYSADLMKHTGVEIAKADDLEMKAGLQTNHNDAVLHAADANAVEGYIQEGLTLMKSHAKAYGGATTKRAEAEYRSGVQHDVIQNLLNAGDDLAATDRMKKVQGQLTAEHLGKILPFLRQETKRGESQRNADLIERNLGVGTVEPGNIDPYNRPILNNLTGEILPPGSDISGLTDYSTTSSFSFQDEEGGPEILIPTVIEGKRLGAKSVADIPEAELADIKEELTRRKMPHTTENILQVSSQREAIDHYHQTGEHLGKFRNAEQADRYAEALHNSQVRVGEGKPKQFTEDEMLSLAKGIENSDVREMTEPKLRQLANDREQREKQLFAQNKSTVYGAINAHADVMTITQLEGMPAFKAMPVGEQDEARGHLRDKGTQLKQIAQSAVEHVAAMKYQQVVHVAAEESREFTREQRAEKQELAEKSRKARIRYNEIMDRPVALEKMSVAEIQAMVPELGDPLVGHLLAYRQKLLDPTTQKVTQAQRGMINKIANEAGMHPFDPTKTEKQKEALGLLDQYFREREEAERFSTGKAVSEERQREIVREGATDIVLAPGWIFSDTTKRAALIRISDIPPKEVERIRTSLGNATDEQVVNQFLYEQRQKKAAPAAAARPIPGSVGVAPIKGKL